DCVEETDRVLVMLNTLMDISEAESGAMQLRREPVALREGVERAIDLYHDVADAKGVALGVDAVDDVVVTADRTRLEQVAANLIDNAGKYTPPGGRDPDGHRGEDPPAGRPRRRGREPGTAACGAARARHGARHSRRRTGAD